jgi:hypothetical protein
MPKWALYVLLAFVDFGFAWYFFTNGRIVLPAILTIAGLCFVAATIGAMAKKDVRGR